MTRLEGQCNHCGLCCMVTGLRGEQLRCGNLSSDNKCKVYETRYNEMPILLIGPGGVLAGVSTCAKDTEEETQLIIHKGIGRGCSLEVINDKEDLKDETEIK